MEWRMNSGWRQQDHTKTSHTPGRTHIFLTQFLCVTYRHRVYARLKVFAVRMSYLSISPSPFSCFTLHPCCSLTVTSRPPSRLLTSTTSLPSFTRPKSAGQAHLRTSAEESGYPADPTHSTKRRRAFITSCPALWNIASIASWFALQFTTATGDWTTALKYAPPQPIRGQVAVW